MTSEQPSPADEKATKAATGSAAAQTKSGAAPDLNTLTEQAAKLTSAGTEGGKEFSAATIARMMGVATVSDLQVLERKVDLLMSKLGLLSTRMDKALTFLNDAPKGSDFERMEVQLGSLKSLIRETFSQADESAASVKKLGEEIGTKDKIAQFLNKKSASDEQTEEETPAE